MSMEEMRAALAEEMKRVAPHADVVREIIAERSRQITEEGWTPEQDDKRIEGELGDAGAAYALGEAGWRWWPWDDGFKPTTRRRNIVKAAALLVAEIERLDRAEREKHEAS